MTQKNGNALTRDQLTSGRHKPKEVEVEQLAGGGVVHLKPLSAGMAFDFRGIDEEDPENRDRLVEAVIESVVDEKGERQLTSEHREAVLGWPISDFNRIVNALVEASALDGQTADAIEGKSETSPSVEPSTD